MTSVLVLTQGVDSGYAWPIVDGSGTPAELAGHTAICQVRRQEIPDGDLLAELTASVVGSAVAVTWNAEESMAWSWTDGWSDVVLIDAAGRPIRVVWQGRVLVDKVVSHA